MSTVDDGMRGAPDFRADSFWDQRLQRDYTLKGVGFRRLGLEYNRWMYAVRRDVFMETVRSTGLDIGRSDILDVGSGTGFYVDLWAELGASSVSGVDISETAVARLRDRHPQMTFSRADVGDEISPLPSSSYDAVSAMDVLFHIVDDRRFRNAIGNIHGALKPGGLFVWSDYFLHGREWRIQHQACRSLADIEGILDGSGFEISQRGPMFVLMANPLDAGWFVRMLWYAAASLVSVSERFGGAVGRILYPREKRLIASRAEGPSTEIMVCRKRI